MPDQDEDHPVRINSGLTNRAGEHVVIGAVCDTCRATWRMGETSDGVTMELAEFKDAHRHD